MRILLLNGPPGSGKDTVAAALRTVSAITSPYITSFAEPIRDAAAGFFSLPTLGAGSYEDAKRTNPRIRQFMIGVGSLARDYWGDNYFADACCDRIGKYAWENVIVTDAGFQAEIERLAFRLRFQARFELWTIGRPGCDYKHDSRGTVVLPSEHGQTKHIDNNGSLEALIKQAEWLGTTFFEQRSVQLDQA